MDPNEALHEIRDLIQQDCRAELGRDDVAALIGRVEALDKWLTGGGSLPKGWAR